MDRWNIINLIITCSGVLDHRQRVVCLKEVKFYRTIQAPKFQSVNFINSFSVFPCLGLASVLCDNVDADILKMHKVDYLDDLLIITIFWEWQSIIINVEKVGQNPFKMNESSDFRPSNIQPL